MTKHLAIITPQVGTLSETFIERHMKDLLPGQTVVVTLNADLPFGGHWNIDCPALIMNQVKWGGLRQGFWNFIARKTGMRSDEDSLFWLLKRFLEEHEVEVILGEYLHFSLPWFLLAQRLNIRFVAHAHGTDISASLREPKCREDYLNYNKSDGIVVPSEVSKIKLIEIGLEPAKVHVIPYGVEVSDAPSLKAENDTIRCLAVGRMVAKKAPILLLDAFRRALEICPNLRLDYVGTGELLPAVKQFVFTFNLTDKVKLHGGLPNETVQKFMKESDLFLQHSITDPDTGDEEGLPVAILEAMSWELPVISTKHAGIPEAVLDGKTGFLVDEGDISSMAKKIVLLAQDLTLRSQLGLAGWQRAKDCFSWEKELGELRKLLGLQL